MAVPLSSALGYDTEKLEVFIERILKLMIGVGRHVGKIISLDRVLHTINGQSAFALHNVSDVLPIVAVRRRVTSDGYAKQTHRVIRPTLGRADGVSFGHIFHILIISRKCLVKG